MPLSGATDTRASAQHERATRTRLRTSIDAWAWVRLQACERGCKRERGTGRECEHMDAAMELDANK